MELILELFKHTDPCNGVYIGYCKKLKKTHDYVLKRMVLPCHEPAGSARLDGEVPSEHCNCCSSALF